MLLSKYKDMDGEVIVVVLQQDYFLSFVFPKKGRDLKGKKRRREKHEFEKKKRGGRVIFERGIESGIFFKQYMDRT